MAGKVGFERESESFNGAFAGHHWLQVDPGLASRQCPMLELWQQAGHDDTRLTRPTWSDDGQKPSTLACGLCWYQHPSYVLDQLVDQVVTPEEVTSVVGGEGSQSLQGIARLLLWYLMRRAEQARDGSALAQVVLNGFEGCRVPGVVCIDPNGLPPAVVLWVGVLVITYPDEDQLPLVEVGQA